MISPRERQILMLLSLLFLIPAYFIGKNLPREFALLSKPSTSRDDSTTAKRLALLNTAVRAVPKPRTFSYTGGFENPFKPWNRMQGDKGKKGSTKSKIPRTTLYLKGILIKDRPLAILENDAGETFIRGVGEKVLEQSIVAIEKNRVTLRDHLGTYDLAVKEH
jgi:hypothetical protein